MKGTSLVARILFFLYPPSFRKEYGREWLELARLRSTSFLLKDTLRMAPRLWLDGGTGPAVRKISPRVSLDPFRASAMETLSQDIRFGLRTLRKRPLFALMSVATLGLGIGAATAIFSVVEGVILRPLPYERPEEVVSAWQTYPEWQEEPSLAHMWDWGYLAYPGYERWREGQTHFQDVAIHATTVRNLSGAGDPERITVGIASSSLFPVLGVQPILGRAFTAEEDEPGTVPVALLSYDFWRESSGGDESVLGTAIRLNEDPFTVVGVLPPGFEFRVMGFMGSTVEKPVWIPVGADGRQRREGSHSYEAVGRLLPGATLEQATPEARNLIPAADEEEGHSVRLVSRKALEAGDLQTPLFLLLGASVVLLLIACGNVASLLMGELARRTHEMATRTALGAGRRRIVRQLLTESVILGLAGSGLGVLLAIWGTKALLSLAPALPRIGQVQVNPAVLSFGMGLGVLTGLLFGLAPAWALIRRGSRESLGMGWRSRGRRDSGFHGGVISVELALTLILLVSGALLTRSLGNLMALDTGFAQDGLIMARAYLPSYRYAESAERGAQVGRMQLALASVPGVRTASGTSSLPFFNAPGSLSYGIEGRPEAEVLSPHTSLRLVLPGFFETMGIRILEGRGILDTDRAGGQPVAVISETMARRHWPDESPLGARILFGDTLEVVGVAADVLHESLDAEPLATMYLPFHREAGTSINFLVRTDMDPEALFPSIREAIWSVDGETPISRVATLPSLIRNSARDERFRAILMVVFALCAALLAGAGVFGVTSRSVAQRSKEMGIRKALGAQPAGLVKLALSGALRAGLVGVAMGLLGAFWASRLLARYLFELQPWDPPIYAAVAGALLALALAASYIPARRAGRVPPMEVLREE